MTRQLRSERRGPPEGEAGAVVVFLHGYGADGRDLLGLAEPMAPHLPGTAFWAPDAPERSAMNPTGYQWFPIPWLDGSSEAAAAAAMQAAAADLDAFLDTVLAREGLGPERMILFGFSQGTMLALDLAPRRAEPVAGIVAFSGRLLRPETLSNGAVSKPPVMLIHGDSDEMVPPQSLSEAGEALQAAGFEVYAHVMPDTGHGIAPDGLSVALAFIRAQLGFADDLG